MALTQDENLATRYYSLPSQIMEARETYYGILKHNNTGDGDITTWIKWVLESMSRAITQISSMRNLIIRLHQIHRAYGTAYLFAWAHRISGIGLFLFLYAHIYTLSDLLEPAQFDSKIKWLGQVGLNYFGMMLALPVIFHALNGGRLILYETFGSRRDERLVSWVAGLTILYWVLLFLAMYFSNISLASLTLDIALLISLALAGGLIMAISKSKMGLYWKIQRISGAFLVIMIPVHLVFMHADPAAGHDSAVILSRIRGNMLIRVADFLIVVSALYHGAYGLISIAKDYLESETLIRGAAILIAVVSILFGWLGIKTIAMV